MLQTLPQISRLALYFFLLLFTVIYQIRYPLFINYDFLMPLYLFLTLALSVNVILLFIDRDKTNLQKTLKYLLPADAVVISLILYKAGLQHSLYLFFYLYLIFITALTFRLRGALNFSVFCSFLFSVVLFLDSNTAPNAKIFLFLMNNLAFFTVAYLSGTLSQQLEAREKDVRELKNINNLIVENIKTGLITLDGKLNVIQSNQSSVEIFGKKILPEEKIQSLVSNFESWKDELASSQIISKEFSIETSDSRKDLELLASKLSLDKNESGYLLLVQDVTEKKRIVERMKNQEKLAAVGQLAAGIAHEIRNPLASMSGSVQLLASSFEQLDDEQKKLISITLKETDRLNLLISEFLEFVRPNLPMEDRVDVSKTLRESLELLQLNKTITTPLLKLDIQPTKLIQANRDKIKQVFLNIMINACHAMDKKEAPELSVSCIQENEAGKETVLVKIKDNGIGMDEKIRKKIFEPFYTTKSRGTGLGLAVAHKIIEAHDAEIDVESQPGIGTTFTLRFKC